MLYFQKEMYKILYDEIVLFSHYIPNQEHKILHQTCAINHFPTIPEYY